MNQDEKEEPQKLSQTTPALSPKADLLAIPDYVPAEVALENIGYFTPSSKRIKHILTKEKRIAEKMGPDGIKKELRVTILATGKYGLPITSDLDYYRAFLKILDEIIDKEGLIPQPISIPIKKLIRYTGKQVNAREFKEVKDWIRRNRYTGIQGFVYKAEKRDFDEIGEEPLFPRYRLRGERMDNGEIAETNYVWLASWFMSNYLHGYLRPIDFAFHQRLRKSIAKSLYPLLETGWYASSTKPYSKSYSDLCQEFLLRQERYLADIKKQLDPSHRELERERFLAKWQYRKAANKTSFIITYWPGQKFFEDQQARETRRRLAEQIRKKPEQLAPTDTDFRLQDLLEDIRQQTADPRWEESIPFYRLAINTLGPDLVRARLSETRQYWREGKINTSKVRFFVDFLARDLQKAKTEELAAH